MATTTKKPAAKPAAKKTETKKTAEKKMPAKTATKKPVAKKTDVKKPAAKKTAKKETTVVMLIEATFILKDGQVPTKDSINLTELCPTADKVDLKKMQVFPKDE